jgi:hypothetical protein
VPAPELAPLGAVATWQVFEIAVTVRWDERRQIEIATLRTTPIQSRTRIPGERS